jgi:hypothetical protein
VFDGPVGGVDPGVGSPEAANAYRPGDPDPPRGPVDPSDRPGCWRGAISLIALIAGLAFLLWLGGEVARLL